MFPNIMFFFPRKSAGILLPARANSFRYPLTMPPPRENYQITVLTFQPLLLCFWSMPCDSGHISYKHIKIQIKHRRWTHDYFTSSGQNHFCKLNSSYRSTLFQATTLKYIHSFCYWYTYICIVAKLCTKISITTPGINRLWFAYPGQLSAWRVSRDA